MRPLQLIPKRRAALAAILLTVYAPGQSAAQTSSQANAKAPIDDSAAEKRIAFLWEKMRQYRLHPAGAPERAYPLQDSLGLRWSNPVSGVVDGGIFIWSDGSRPHVIGKCYLNESKGAWGEAIQSVSPAPLVMTFKEKPIWTPAGPGVDFHPIRAQPKPSDSAGVRLGQMRSLARQIQVVGIWGEVESSEWRLRMLTTPIHRYNFEEEGVVDAAVFGYTQGGTNPEAIALIEIVRQDGELGWRVAVTRLSKYGIRAVLDGATIADLPRNDAPDISEPFYSDWHWFVRYPFPKLGASAEDGT
jgi:hypothetical protein